MAAPIRRKQSPELAGRPAALVGLEAELPRLAFYVSHATMVASVLAELPGARVNPLPPHTHQFQLWLPYPAESIDAAALALAEEQKIWFAGRWVEKPPTGMARTEVTVTRPASDLSSQTSPRRAAS